MYIIKKEKCGNCETLSPKYTINGNNFFIKIKSILIKAIGILYQTSPIDSTWFLIIKMRNQGVYH